MKAPILVALAVLATGPVLAQSQVEIPIENGTLTVNSVPPQITNASEYRIKVADLDTNGDGYISRSEVPASHALAFEWKLVDTDRNGRVTDTELANWK